ncbi:TonB-dependent receptor plug domain-containing protein, partial [Proteus mirabilis]
IPDAIVDRIEVLKDGASSTYGADAIAGVVNVIMKKEVTGIHLNASAGISDRGDGAEQRIDATVGYGSLAEQGFNFYISGEYQKNDKIMARDRDYPFNTNDLSRIC